MTRTAEQRIRVSVRNETLWLSSSLRDGVDEWVFIWRLSNNRPLFIECDWWHDGEYHEYAHASELPDAAKQIMESILSDDDFYTQVNYLIDIEVGQQISAWERRGTDAKLAKAEAEGGTS